jgi:hypothetical protein
MQVQEVWWNKGGNEPADDYTSFCGNGITDHHLGTDFFIHKAIISAVKRVDTVTKSMPYITLKDKYNC